jgi:hypothetical protein
MTRCEPSWRATLTRWRRWDLYDILALIPPLRNRFISALVQLRFGPQPA